MARLSWSITARRDLRTIREHIAFDSPRAAELLTGRIIRVASRLRQFPKLGRVLPGSEDDNLRELIFENYRVVYLIRGRDVYIARVIHSAMDIKRISFEGWL